MPRDLQICYAPGWVGPLNSDDVARLCFAGKHSVVHTRRRLRKLEKLGLVARHQPKDPAAPAWWGLTPEGRSWVAEQTGVPAEELRTLAGVHRMNLVHHKMLVRLRIDFVLAVRRDGQLQLRRFIPEHTLRADAQRHRCPLVPDALVLLGRYGNPHPLAWAVEADTGRERYEVWHTKANAYRQLHSTGALLYGYAPWGLLVVVPDDKRAGAVARVLDHEGCGAFALLGVSAQLDETNVLGHGWLGADRLAHDEKDARVSLAELAEKWFDEVVRRPGSLVEPGSEVGSEVIS